MRGVHALFELDYIVIEGHARESGTLSPPRGLQLQLVAGEPSDAVSGGRWRWAGTRLMYDLGERTNRGQYYSCPDGSVYMNMQEYVDGSL